ncbi:glycosyltransferase family 39 protein [Babjeviella inositovora NRRL Y-12698]|uniref:Dolichyl-phosphate-mannose--protein mannosyltransferase n=1 Tax=Babjeviella inositovora NRRL Y-12698 TaxID=984486 RepID=A0A1E3QIR0_9ASCO|nr:glycosyltransferase family 39 protein [Babjeviella inositovora NRRL Y-12698]ODQ77488.1 glycosyltransferase family 39 protein [Babjeviella inositovora NRRL Y-12698]
MSLKFRGASEAIDEQVETIIAKTSGLDIGEGLDEVEPEPYYYDGMNEDTEYELALLAAQTNYSKLFIPLLIFLASFLVRAYKIGLSKLVVWDEAHFGKFGAYYLKREFYFDVHPPLGKMLVAFSGWLANFSGEFEFDSGSSFPDHVDFRSMRLFQAVVGGLVPMFAYLTMENLQLASGKWASWLVVIMTCFETLSVQLSKFVLLDALLLAFTVSTFFCMTQVHRLRASGKEFTFSWYAWLVLSGVSIGCVCSVKWVGLFVTATYGCYVLYDLGRKHFDLGLSRARYYSHWAIRVATLIVIPLVVYLISFKLHFMILNKSGTGNGSMSSLFQANLRNTDIDLTAPRSLALGSAVTLRSHGLSSNLLHSHQHLYPEGSKQRQITTYGHKDENNVWIVYPPHQEFDGLPTTSLIQDGQVIRLVHNSTGGNLHSHPIKAPMSKSSYEVSGYGDRNAFKDGNDYWVVEIVEQLQEDDTAFHPLSTNFRLRHLEMGCYLATTGLALPKWGFDQGEVVCKNSWISRDKATWWNVELHENLVLPLVQDYIPPSSRFFKDFVLLNFAMMASNNALVLDPNKNDDLASSWWQWPSVNIGLRMCSWSAKSVRYYMLSHPFTTLASTASLGVFLAIVASKIYNYQRQLLRLDNVQFEQFLVGGVFPFLGWLFNFYPFAIMGRVTYVHHYLPSLYFATFVLVFVLDYFVGHTHYVKPPVYLALYATTIGFYWHFSPFVYGMEGDHNQYRYLQWFSKWHMLH